MSTQQELEFNTRLYLHGEYPLRYHLLRVGDGDLAGKFWHVNTIFEGYNSDGYPQGEISERIVSYRWAKNPMDIRNIIIENSKKENPNKTFYIMADMDADVYRKMPEYKY